jgi:alkane 1-monooxygenase
MPLESNNNMLFPKFRLSDARFLLILLLPGLTLLNTLTAPRLAAAGALVVWLLVAAVDSFLPGARRSPGPSETQPYFIWLLRLYVPLQWVLIGCGAWAAMHSDWLTVAGLAFAVGFVTGGQGITFAHELGHSKNRIDRALAWLLMASVNYSHFMVEHYRGHHPRAATFDDPASARRGESLWGFLPRTVWGSWSSAWRLEAQRLQQRRKSWLYSPLLWCCMLNLALAIVLVAGAASKIIVFWLGQSLFAIWLLETVNYIEHYGLSRKISADSKREPFAMNHAWNADHVVSNSLLANLQRHSDHHMHAWKPYPTLQALPGPQLPTGYAGCLLLAVLPPVWFALMHKRLDAMNLANQT